MGKAGSLTEQEGAQFFLRTLPKAGMLVGGMGEALQTVSGAIGFCHLKARCGQ